MAFVLLLHSPEMHESQWVDIEITHALKSGLPIIVLKWNTTTTEIPKINRFPTIDFNPDIDMRNGLIQASKLDEITQLVESAHADGIYRRRRESVEAVRQIVTRNGATVVEQPRWKLLATWNNNESQPAVIAVESRLTSPQSLYELDVWPVPEGVDPNVQWNRVLIQNSKFMPRPRQELLEWVIGDRDINIALGFDELDRWLTSY